MRKAIWNGVVIAESETTVQIEGNHYFPPNTIKKEYFEESDLHSNCPWKGVASYYNVVIDGKTNKDAAWYYPEVSDLAKSIKGYVAFWKGVTIEVK
ncbi:DUF427 domain-containing protein [Flavobacteriales bacterium]|nr:DUF427 domain-containing protein [Flavobacteriales bacterium]